ncbi:MAG: HDOD domain-containing protein [Pseudomonadales bacterium]|nr:HDOD domain-containing protein [Pseudomonadales bacterium]
MKTILFVDDEINVLSGLKRSLRKQRDQWHMLFADNGASALDIFNKQTVDVLVTDMQMPGMSGDQLLGKVIAVSPATARIVLTGHADLAKLAKASECAHRFVSKPCAGDQLIEIIEELLFTQKMVDNDLIRELMGKIGKLPSLPSVYHNVSNAIDSQSASADQIALMIEKDGGMSAKVLQLANSPLFFGTRFVSSIQEAITRFGMEQLKLLVLRCSLFQCFEASDATPEVITDSFWKYSLAVAELAKEIAFATGQEGDRLDQAYIAGLMHEIGYLILVDHDAEKFGQLCEAIKRNPGDSLRDSACDDTDETIETPETLERQIFEVSHNEAAGYLLSLWNIPARVVEAVYFHHTPSASGYRGMNATTAVHCAAAIICEYEAAGWPFKTFLDMKYLEEVGVLDEIEHWRELAEPIMERLSNGDSE